MRDGLNAPHAKQETLQTRGPLRLEAGLQENSRLSASLIVESGQVLQCRKSKKRCFSSVCYQCFGPILIEGTLFFNFLLPALFRMFYADAPA